MISAFWRLRKVAALLFSVAFVGMNIGCGGSPPDTNSSTFTPSGQTAPNPNADNNSASTAPIVVNVQDPGNAVAGIVLRPAGDSFALLALKDAEGNPISATGANFRGAD